MTLLSNPSSVSTGGTIHSRDRGPQSEEHRLAKEYKENFSASSLGKRLGEELSELRLIRRSIGALYLLESCNGPCIRAEEIKDRLEAKNILHADFKIGEMDYESVAAVAQAEIVDRHIMSLEFAQSNFANRRDLVYDAMVIGPDGKSGWTFQAVTFGGVLLTSPTTEVTLADKIPSTVEDNPEPTMSFRDFIAKNPPPASSVAN